MKRKHTEDEPSGSDDPPSSPSKRQRSALSSPVGDSIAVKRPIIETPKKRRGRPPGSKTKPKAVPNGISGSPVPQRSASPSQRDDAGTQSVIVPQQDTLAPTKRRRGRPPGSKNKPKADINGSIDSPFLKVSTPKSTSKDPFSTPTKPRASPSAHGTTPLRNADQSARRKSARQLIERTIAQNDSSAEEQSEDDLLARRIWNDDDSASSDSAAEDAIAVHSPSTTDPNATTPSRRGRGRPKGSRNKPSPPPPPNLPPQEQYFYHNRPHGSKTSDNTLASVPLLDHAEYFRLTASLPDLHAPEIAHLSSLHARSFPQWRFELSEGFNICLYGWGSKRDLAMSFADFLHQHSSDPPTVLVVNGYTPNLTPRAILHLLSTTLLPSQPKPVLDPSTLLSLLPTTSPPPLVIIHSIDALPLRRPATQSLLASLASHPCLTLLATADHPSFPLLWDASTRAAFNFLHHDTTTFAPLAAETDPVGAVHDLLCRTGRRVGGKEGVAFVLKSLSGNARSLYRMLVAECLGDDGGADAVGDGGGDGEAGVEYRVLYHKAVEEFVCSNEVAFRTLLKEFHDHQMLSSRKDVLGTELLWVPFPRQELEAILEDLIG
ncbi:MAG: Origin recognition complex subunit 2 [Piccolia ochrophora]|nr:MAG: Origin recognition complex subunit 2 [Piccolia ochrophora]